MIRAVTEGAQPDRRRLFSFDEVASELTRLARLGLPVAPEEAGDLAYLTVVLAYARGTDHVARVVAFNDLLARLLTELEGYGKAARILFGLPPALRTWSFSTRQAEAAKEVGYNVDHFRKHVQRRLVNDVAYELVSRNLRYRAAPERRLLAEEQSDWRTPATRDDLELLEIEARIYEELYGLRADHLALLRLKEQSDIIADQYAKECLWHYVQMHGMLVDLRDRYGATLIGQRLDGEDRLAAALQWRGPFLDDEVAVLRRLSAAGGTSGDFFNDLQGHEAGDAILGKWRAWLQSAMA